MALNIPTYPNPFNRSTPLENAYGWIAGINLDISRNTGALVVNIHPEESAWTSDPISQITVSMGQPLDSGHFPNLDELFGDQDFLSAYNTIGGKLYMYLLDLPAFSGATLI